MADEGTNQDQAQHASTATTGTSAGTQNTDTPGPVPYDRFKAVNEELAELRKWRKAQEAQAAEAKKAADAAEAERLAKAQEWQKLAEKKEQDLAAEAERRAAIEAQLRDHQLSDAMRREAAGKKLAFANDVAAKDALVILRTEGKLDGLDLDKDAGALGAVLDALKTERPYLFRETVAPASIDAGARGGGQAMTDAERMAEIKQRYRIK